MGTPAGINRASVVVFESDETTDSVLEGFTITGGRGFLDASQNEWVGGGIFFVASSGTVRNCAIMQNTAMDGGGVLCAYPCSPNLIDCTITENSASSEYGAVLCMENSLLTITNSIIWANTAPGGHEIGVTEGATFSISYSNVVGGQTEVSVVGGTLNWGEGNIDTDPLFADPNNEDYHLKSEAGRWDPNSQTWVRDDVTSPCIDGGDPMSPIGWESFPNGGFVNMGAYGATAKASRSYFGEPICTTIVAGDINGDCQVNRADLEIMALHWTDDVPLPLP